jgi:protein SCO1/2
MSRTSIMRRLARGVLALLVAGQVASSRAEPSGQSTRARYQIPDVTLVRADGARVRFRRELDDGRPVILNFLFTTCSAVCPLMSQTFAQLQPRLDENVHLVSISIDPEHDTPSRLKDYAEKVGAGPRWSFYTGTLEASIALQRAFGVYRGNKMNHDPLTFVRVAPDQPWVRIEGFARADAILARYRRLLAAGGPEAPSAP